MDAITKNHFYAHPELGFWSWKIAPDLLIWSETVSRFFGLPEREDVPKWDQQARLYTPKSFALLQAALSDCVKTGEPFTLLLEGIHSSGKIIYLNVYGAAERDASGKIIGLFGQFIDRTERENLKKALELSCDKFTLSFEHAPIGMAVVSIKGKFLEANASLSKLLGYSRDELLQLTFQQITHADELLEDLERLNQLLAEKILEDSREKRYIHKSGSIIWVRVSTSLARNTEGEPLYFISQMLDITQSKNSVAILRHAQMGLQEVSQGVVISDANRKILYSNKAFSFITGYSAEEILGKDCKLLQGPQTDPETVKRISFSLRNGMDFHGEILNYRKNGLTYWNELSVLPVHDEHGNITNFIGTSSDISTKVRARQILEEKSAVLSTILDSSATGYMVTDKVGNRLYQNQQCLNLYNIPSDIAEDPSWIHQLEWVANTVKDKQTFLSRISLVKENSQEQTRDIIELKNGRILERISIPILMKDGSFYARLCSIRDVSGQPIA